MSLNSALSIATSGLANINAQFITMSQNVANVSTPGYTEETTPQQSVTAGGIGMGVRTGITTRATDVALQAELSAQVSNSAGLTVTQAALQAIDGVLGTPGQGDDLPSMVGSLQESFSTLLSDPSNQAQQSAVVNAAGGLAQTVNTISSTITTQRQGVEDDLGVAVDSLNSTLSQIGQLNREIVAGKQAGTSTAGLESQRDGALQTLSGLVSFKALPQQDGSVQLVTASGLTLPTQADGAAFSFQGGAAAPQSYYPDGGLSGIALNGTDVTSALTGGRIGADLTLRDTTLPTAQAQLDEFSYGLANRFSAQGLTLFTDSQGNLPVATGTGGTQTGYVGFSARIQVNPQVSADPSLVRDGTTAIAGSSSGASAFTPNPSGGPAGFSTLISRVLNYTFGDEAQPGVSQPAPASTALGPDGNLSAPSGGVATLSGIATALVSGLSEQSATVTTNLTAANSLQSALSSQLNSTTGVNLDSEMSKMVTLQTAYGANARVLSAVETMFNEILQVVT
ncbi:MAG TPA: flagellar hook-associated protein FlgK [Rhodopila sp.]|uniref:flagellar hook-associated protein FlgK n=1 Tax=Rhodopila sp. TaxID=2480087 RepID=UPI002B6BEA59|nr:flagellar hook-associated protein FlgK [Rhodopila sp.]HVY16218.1 flagellar hook-associated protein FlgK [Rhodopila sp.]